MQTSRNADLRGDGERGLKWWAAAALARAAGLMIEGISARGQAIMGGPPSEKLADRRPSTWSKR